MPYRALQCLTEAGVTVYVLGGRGARGLKFSRRAAEVVATEAAVDGAASDALVNDVNAAIARWGIEIVLAGDAQATRSLIAMRERLAARAFPMPSLDVFDWLNDKWRFYELCMSLGVRVPKSRLFESVTDLRRAFDQGELASPKIAKPLSMTGSEGCLRVDPENAPRLLAISAISRSSFRTSSKARTSARARFARQAKSGPSYRPSVRAQRLPSLPRTRAFFPMSKRSSAQWVTKVYATLT